MPYFLSHDPSKIYKNRTAARKNTKGFTIPEITTLQEDQGVFVPASLWEAKDLTLQEVICITLVIQFPLSFTNPDIECGYTNKQIGKLLGVKKERTGQIINNIKEKQYFNCKYYRGNGVDTVSRIITPTQKYYDLFKEA